jgi:hypothetical protein
MMAGAADIESTRPEMALAIFDDLAERASFPYRDIARERCAVILWRLGRHREAVRAYRKSAEARDRESTYVRARHSVMRLAELDVDSDHGTNFDGQLGRRLGEAERIFERNGDLFMIARLRRLRAGLDTDPVEPIAASPG